MSEFVDVNKEFYKEFLDWGKAHIEGFHYEVFTTADRTLIKNGKGELLGYRNLAYQETFHIKSEVFKMLFLIRELDR